MSINKIMNNIRNTSLVLLALLAVSAVFLPATGVLAQNTYDCTTATTSKDYNPTQAGLCDAVHEDNQVQVFGDTNSVFERVVNVLLFLVGSISVIMLIVGGIRYIVSSGDQNQVTGAKNTIMYAIIGIVVAVVAYGIVNFLLGRLYGTG